MIVGMDFGTTNSGMAVFDGRAVNVLPLDPSNNNPRVARTALYVTNDQSVRIGRGAVDRYFEHNIGRRVKMQKVWIGELEIYGADMYYVTDAYAFVDVFSPGRLFLSMKTSLRDADYPGTVVGQFYYPLEDLVGLYMTVTRLRAEKLLGEPVRQVVLGRPVRFATDAEHDALAQSRLLRAAFCAGYERVYLQYEPVAAAFSYEKTIDREQNVLVFDFGGGTLDITVMRLGDPKRRSVLATGGIPIAGDIFDQRLVRSKLPRHFGEGSFYGPRHKALQVPRWIYDAFANWQTILELQAAENRDILQEIHQTAQRRYQIEALINLVASNYGLRMFDIVERAKRRLSEKRGAEILLEGNGFSVREFVTRTEFEHIIRNEIQAIETHLDETIAAAGLPLSQIDAVIRTGGSSQIPVFHEMLQRKFGADKVRTVDTFSSVTAGLGIMAHGVEMGEIEAKAFVPADVGFEEVSPSRPNVSPVNLELVQRRIVVDETGSMETSMGAGMCLVMVGSEGKVSAATLSPASFEQAKPLSLTEMGFDGDGVQAVTAPIDERLLFITSHFRFLLATPRQLIDLANIDLAITDLHRFETHEKVCAVCNWDALKRREKLLLVTSSGYTRTYPLGILSVNVEAPVPMKFDQPLPGVPVVAMGTGGQGELALTTRKGRAARLNMRMVLTSGFQAVNCGPDDRLMVADLVEGGEELLLVTQDGYGRRLSAGWLPLSDKANVKGKSVVARRSDVVCIAGYHPDRPVWLVTSHRIVAADAGRLPHEDSNKTKPLLKLEEGEMVRTTLAV